MDGEGRARAVVGPLSSSRTAAESREALDTPAREVDVLDGEGPSTALFSGAWSLRLAKARRSSMLQNAERHTDAQTAVINAHSTAGSMSRWVESASLVIGWRFRGQIVKRTQKLFRKTELLVFRRAYKAEK